MFERGKNDGTIFNDYDYSYPIKVVRNFYFLGKRIDTYFFEILI